MEEKKLFCVSLGCDKNLVDTEKMLRLLRDMGIVFTDDQKEADIILINTCCFIGDAKEESVNTILEMAQEKEEGRCRALIVTGCLAQRYKDEILQEIPEVDAILGTTSWEEIGGVVRRILGSGEEHVACFHDLKELPSAFFLQTTQWKTSGPSPLMVMDFSSYMYRISLSGMDFLARARRV